MRASCQCGQLSAEITAPTDQIVACHCHACQRRTGSPFGIIAYYPGEAVRLSGTAKEYSREADSGNRFTNGFCADCGTSLRFRSEAKPDAIGIAVGTFADPDFPAPVRSVWESGKHAWVTIPGEIQHFPEGRR